ncbi:phosphatase PAP2 family protein [Pontibacter sp. MBLB2868]|uniref:phosphatase PAP2 family protein n=1 Tax=Pontibacter sp. MBLB2868 TaxID=3451555 RepID=UPI003F74EEEA
MIQKPLTIISCKIDDFFEWDQIQKLENKYPKLVGFLHNRLGMQGFFGLPFTSLLLVVFVNLSLLTEISEHIVNSTSLKSLDSTVSLFLFDMRTDMVSNAIYYFTQLGSEMGVAAMFLCALFFLFLKKKWHYSVALIVSVLGTGISTYFTKEHFHRERPLDIGYYKLSTFSFPSGHAAGSVALVGMFCVLVYMSRENIKYVSLWITLGLLYIVLIGFSRIYLGVHFVTDVAGGYLLGILWVIVAISVLEYLMLRKKAAIARLK